MRKKELSQILREWEGQFIEFKKNLDDSLLKDKGFLERVGSDKTGYWKVTHDGMQAIRRS